MKIHRKAAVIGAVLASPLMFAATSLWLEGAKHKAFYDDTYMLGDVIFGGLGFPLGTFVLKFFLSLSGGQFNQTTEMLALPFLNSAFLIQWVIWSQTLVLLWRNGDKIIIGAADFVAKLLSGKSMS